MKRLNKIASELAVEFGVRGGTDITGFGLMGHGWEMAKGAGVRLRIHLDAIPFTSAARKFAEAGTFPGGSLDNRNYYSPHVVFSTTLKNWEQTLLFDAQTSGGLLLAVPREKAGAFEARAAEARQPVWEIGEVVNGVGIEVVN
jgi:selenide,water dikinase